MVGCVCVFGHQCVNECGQLISGSDVSFVYVVCVSYMCLAYKGKSVYIYIYMVWVVAHQKFLHHPSPHHPTSTSNTQTALGLRSLLDSAFTGRPSILNRRRAEGEGVRLGLSRRPLTLSGAFVAQSVGQSVNDKRQPRAARAC